MEIDGVCLETHPWRYVVPPHLSDLFTDAIRSSKIGLISLLNYPHPQRQCFFIDRFELRSESSSTPSSTFDWVELRQNLVTFSCALSVTSTAIDFTDAVAVLQQALEKHRFSKVIKVGIHVLS